MDRESQGHFDKGSQNNARTRESSATENVPNPQSLPPASRAPIAEKRLPPQSQLVAMVPEPEPESTEPALMEPESELTDPPKEPEPRVPEELSVTEQVLMSSQISNDHLSRIEGELDIELKDDQEHMLVGPFDAITPVNLVVDGLMKGNNSHHDVLEAVSSFSTVMKDSMTVAAVAKDVAQNQAKSKAKKTYVSLDFSGSTSSAMVAFDEHQEKDKESSQQKSPPNRFALAAQKAADKFRQELLEHEKAKVTTAWMRFSELRQECSKQILMMLQIVVLIKVCLQMT